MGSHGEVLGLVVFGLIALLVFCLVFAPARLLAPLVEPIPGASLTGMRGTVWAGSGQLLLGGRDYGLFTWALRPASLLRLFPGIAWTLSGEHTELQGVLNLAPSRMAASMSGSVAAEAVNPWLGIYELSLAGHFDLQNLYLHLADNRPDDAQGTLAWSGGRLGYVLSQQAKTTQLPPLQATLEFMNGPRAIVVEQGRNEPLLKAELLDNGFVRIGVTMLLTRLLNEPWPGGGADDKVVVAVEEKIF